jgi:hypothetical protein
VGDDVEEAQELAVEAPAGGDDAVAQRVQVAEHTLRRHRVPPYTQDDLAFPATLPSADV